ncbi:hypothetical protein LTR36_002027 [Oleoguttula mirabilis]|uniref:Translation initiation factor eIF4e n=1 Tax=Oleoguttula mirabilis TaxID=1507867 RepID=A0AAV9JMY2_9PEZI|nr:hypothetical protein LTR36_002027 [Oleoguttula mirabilis]
MADSSSPPRLTVSGLPHLAAEDATTTTSPARGAEMKNFLQARLQKNRAPPLVHSWDFYHDRQDRTQSTNLSSTNTTSVTTGQQGGDGEDNYEARLEKLAVIDDVRKFWNVFNHFPIHNLALRDSIHLFHKGVKPVWEDPRNTRGGAWTFRVPKHHAQEFWQEVCMMAIGEQLQNAVHDEKRERFRDDICGVSLGVRFNSMLVQVWNRDGEHQEGIDAISETVLENLSEELRPREGSYYYKKHSEHSGFAVPLAAGAESGSRPSTSTGASIDAVLQDNA